ncbi:GPR endopeptidase [Clostridium cochlearium]|uniref:GPR endopeptidase n=1 Tax=Clostridium cochlearium TaxID=1494 RepID=UPI000B94CD4F|nr:GPR endopeptidase [Clostridium cochlearium]MBV1819750.1 GPR endopeptidase [Bacteroidales bacterium MSK.15.36]NSJ91480.1 GPR endopeptidase [Coprococcus sp. MSK.21.13]MCG4571725.1 GPR endopeptidase [Clostridium cochlearium]MCG4578648.1 GPR endopeptidase [Clostridium cochlearium]NME94666.1 GPR endopeptidase [Clostridium cochlearium]
MSVRTDLAVEAKEIYEEKNTGEIPGVELKEYRKGRVKITEVNVLNEQGEKAMNKAIGNYITLDIPNVNEYDTKYKEHISKILANTLIPLLKVDESMTALVVGLGNWNITPDSLGPKVVENIMITRHLKQYIPNEIDEGIRPVCGISPGVLGITGIETAEIIKAVSQKISPDIIICIDALASRRLERVNRTIQIGNTGISPGAGVGNRRMELNEKTLGVPVIAIGVPTVVDAATVANDTIDMVIDEMIKVADKDKNFYNMLKSLNRDEKEKMIKEVLTPYVGELMVTPKDVDTLMDSISKIISTGINIALQPALDLEDINSYLN